MYFRTEIGDHNRMATNVQIFVFPFQHANEDVEKMILGNKCDMPDKRVVSQDRGEAVSCGKNPFTWVPNNN